MGHRLTLQIFRFTTILWQKASEFWPSHTSPTVKKGLWWPYRKKQKKVAGQQKWSGRQLMQILGKCGPSHMVSDLFWWTRFHLVDLLWIEYSSSSVYVKKSCFFKQKHSRRRKEEYSRTLLKNPTFYRQSHKYLTCLLHWILDAIQENKMEENYFLEV